MNEQERWALKIQQERELNKRRIGIDWNIIQKYRLNKFELMPDNKEAFYLACDFIHVTSEGISPCVAFKTDGDNGELDDWYDQHNYTHHFLTLAGDYGTGKTHLAFGILIAAVEQELSAIYYQVPDLLAQLRASFDDDTGDKRRLIMNRCLNSSVLVLDDLGMEKATPWAIEQLDSIIDSRYMCNEIYTIFTTNLTPSELPPRIASRLSEGESATLTGPDYRKLMAKRRAEKRHFIGEAEKIISKKDSDNVE